MAGVDSLSNPPECIFLVIGNGEVWIAIVLHILFLADSFPPMRKWPAAVLFDFDGVIVNSEPLHFQAFYKVLAAEKIFITEAEYYEEMIGFDDRGAFKHIFEKHGRVLDPKTRLRVETLKSEAMMDLIHRKQFSALPGVEEFVRGLWRNYPLVIVSGALREEIEVMLEGIALRDCFKLIIAAEDVTVGKPDPQGYLLATKQLGMKLKQDIDPENVLIVEDAPTVIQAVQAKGFKALAVSNSYPAEKLSAANWVVKSLQIDEVKNVLPQLKTDV